MYREKRYFIAAWLFWCIILAAACLETGNSQSLLSTHLLVWIIKSFEKRVLLASLHQTSPPLGTLQVPSSLVHPVRVDSHMMSLCVDWLEETGRNWISPHCPFWDAHSTQQKMYLNRNLILPVAMSFTQRIVIWESMLLPSVMQHEIVCAAVAHIYMVQFN